MLPSCSPSCNRIGPVILEGFRLMRSNQVQERAVRSFFSIQGSRVSRVSVCRGLSCEMNGAAAITAALKERGGCETVYCLGFCDHAPAILLPEGVTLCGEQARSWPQAALTAISETVDIRAVSRHAVVTERLALGDFSDLSRARQAGVYHALISALHSTPAAVLAEVESSGQQGRGGAGFPTGRKWRSCAQARGPTRYVVANGDEGDPGSFIDRLLLENDPHAVLEGLMLCGYATGSSEGVIYIRAEYPRARAQMSQAIAEAREAGLLGSSVLGYPFSFDARVVSGEGSYVCGEETALLNAIEGRRGEVRIRPPYPTEIGLHGRPTIVNNIETLVNIPWIIRKGANAYRRLGTRTSPGTKAFCFNNGFARPGVVEAEFGINLRELVEVHAGGSKHGEALAAVVIGGPMGNVLPPSRWDITIDYDELHRHDISLGHGGLVAIPASADLRAVLRSWARFMADESCGRCAPCSLGSRRALDLIEQWCDLPAPDREVAVGIKRLLQTIAATSLCGFGQGIPRPMISLLEMMVDQPEIRRDDHE